MSQIDPTAEAFLVRLSDGNFVADADGSAITTTSVLSHARHTSYLIADQTAQAMRKRGHREAIVCDYMGRPITAAALKLEQDTRAANYERFWK